MFHVGFEWYSYMNGMIMDQWLSAWNIWISGEKLPDAFILWSHSLTWWNRFGQFAQLFSALIVIAEIVGVDRLRKIGKTKLKNIDDGPILRVLRSRNHKIVLLILFFSRFAYGLFLDQMHSYPLTDSRIIIEEIRLSLADIFVIYGALTLPYALFISANYAIIKIMSSEWSDRILKLIALALGIIGFHFTLLAS